MANDCFVFIKMAILSRLGQVIKGWDRIMGCPRQVPIRTKKKKNDP